MIRTVSPLWPASSNIRAFTTTRQGGHSTTPYDSLNVGHHVGDDLDQVIQNRQQLLNHFNLPNAPVWLNQTHSTNVLNLTGIRPTDYPNADAAFTCNPSVVCCVVSADCLPILLCDKKGTTVAAIHAGWRGLAAGILEKTIGQLNLPPSEVLIWLGPAIGPNAFEVGNDVLDAFVQDNPALQVAFRPKSNNKWLCDSYHIARIKCDALGIKNCYGGNLCTYSDTEQFFSYRRDGKTGRMASIIWIQEETQP